MKLRHVFPAALLVVAWTGCGKPADAPPLDPKPLLAAPVPAHGEPLRFGDPRWRTNDQLYGLTWMADGTLITCGNDHIIRSWDAAGGLAWSSDAVHDQTYLVQPALGGKVLVVASSSTEVSVLDARTRAVVATYPGHGIISKNGLVSPDGNFFAVEGGAFNTFVWDLRTGRRAQTPDHDCGSEDQYAFLGESGGVCRLAIGTNPIQVIDARTGATIQRGPSSKHFIGAYAIDARQQRLLVAGEKFVAELNPVTLAPRRQLAATVYFHLAAFHPGGAWAITMAASGGGMAPTACA
jgi:WD40 repeat protein